MLFSVITVCYNALEDFRKTAENVLGQTFDDFEYIVVDGASSDGTDKAAFEYKEKFLLRNIPCTVVSEKDTGIYNAMNKAIDMASGDFLIFMNAGDIFFSQTVLSEMAPFCTKDCDVVYAHTVAREHGLYKEYKASEDISVLRDHWCMGHQSTFTGAGIMKMFHYDEENFRICADYDFYLKALNNGAKFRYVDKFVAEINMYGVSIVNYKKSLTENFKVLLKNGCITEERYEKEVAEVNAEAARREKKAWQRKFIPEFMFRIKRKREGWTEKRPEQII